MRSQACPDTITEGESGPLPGLQGCAGLKQGNQGPGRGPLKIMSSLASTQCGMLALTLSPSILTYGTGTKRAPPSWFRESWTPLSTTVRIHLTGDHEPQRHNKSWSNE